MITNDDKPGNIDVRVFANVRQIAHFQTRDLINAVDESNRIRSERALRGLPTAYAEVRTILSRRPSGRGLILSDNTQRIEF